MCGNAGVWVTYTCEKCGCQNDRQINEVEQPQIIECGLSNEQTGWEKCEGYTIVFLKVLTTPYEPVPVQEIL